MTILTWLNSHKKQIIVAAITIIVVIFLVAGLRWPPEKMSETGWFLTLVAVVILLVAATIYSIHPPRPGEETMPRWKRTFLMAYLLVFGVGLVLMLLSLSSLDFPETPAVPQEVQLPTPTPAQPTPSPTAGQPAAPAPVATPIVPILQRVFPQATGGNLPTQYVTIYGRNFQQNSKVRFNRSGVMTEFQADNLLKAQLRAQDVSGNGSIMIEVANPDGTVSNAILLPIEKPRVRLNVLFFWRFWQPWITREVQLLLLVVFAGALGSYLHGLMSLADFIGGRKLKVSWFWWYLTRPFLGMAMGLIFYAMLRGGFLVGTPADEKFVSPFGVIAIGALVGMFSDKAAQKLGEIFDVVFRAATPRPDKLDETVPVISKLEPSTAKAGSPDTMVKITGEHLSSVKTVKINEDARTAAITNDKEMTVMLNAKDLEKPSSIQITVVDADGDTSAAATFEVTAKDDAEVTAKDDAEVTAKDDAEVTAKDDAEVTAKDDAEVTAKDDAEVTEDDAVG